MISSNENSKADRKNEDEIVFFHFRQTHYHSLIHVEAYDSEN